MNPSMMLLMSFVTLASSFHMMMTHTIREKLRQGRQKRC